MISPLPSNFSSKVSYLRNYSKAPIRILPQQTGTIKNGQLFKVILPVGVVLDLSTFAVHFDFVAKAQNNTDVPVDCTVGMPKYGGNGLVDTFECYINGRNVQTIQSYNRIYSILKDFKSNHTSLLRKLSNNSDPSVYQTISTTGVITKNNTRLAPLNGTAINFGGRYVMDDFIGFLDCKPNIIDTNLTGPIELSFRMANSEVLWKFGAAVTGVSYEISNIVCYCDAIYFKDDAYYSQLKVAMQQEDGFKIVYDNFGVYAGSALTNSKTTNVKCTENCKSLDYILWTYFDNTSTGLQALQLGDGNGGAADAAAILAGTPARQVYNFDNLVRIRDSSLLNNSVYFRRNGVADSLTVEFQINSQPVTIPMNIQEQWEETLKCFELHLDSDNTQINPAITSIPVFQKDFYVCGLSTSHIGNKYPDLMPLISGRDTMSTSVNIVVNSVDKTADNSHGSCQPFVITKFTSVLHVTGERNVLPSR
jgi:hypothetical protein